MVKHCYIRVLIQQYTQQRLGRCHCFPLFHRSCHLTLISDWVPGHWLWLHVPHIPWLCDPPFHKLRLTSFWPCIDGISGLRWGRIWPPPLSNLWLHVLFFHDCTFWRLLLLFCIVSIGWNLKRNSPWILVFVCCCIVSIVQLVACNVCRLLRFAWTRRWDRRTSFIFARFG